MDVLPQALERISWGAILAGAVIAIIIQLALNLLGIGLGATSLDPEYVDESTPKQLGTGAAVWIGFSTLVALFIGGWLTARFAGIPNRTDGFIHGITTWAVVTAATVFLLTTAIGRILSGTSGLISHGLHIARQTAETVAKSAAGIVQGAAQGAANVVGGASGLAQNAARGIAETAQNTAQAAMSQMPDVPDTLRQPDQLFQSIVEEGRKLLQQAGISPDQVQNQANNAVQDVQNAVKSAAQNPSEAMQIFSDTLQRVLRRTQGVVNQADRDAVIDLLVANGKMSREQAQQTMARWEDTYNRAKTQAQQTAEQLGQQAQQRVYDVQQQAQELTQQARQKVSDVQQQAQQKAEELRRDAERLARDTADKARKAIAQLALAAFAAILISGIAAGIGGAIGAPDSVSLPVARTPIDIIPSPSPAP